MATELTRLLTASVHGLGAFEGEESFEAFDEGDLGAYAWNVPRSGEGAGYQTTKGYTRRIQVPPRGSRRSTIFNRAENPRFAHTGTVKATYTEPSDYRYIGIQDPKFHGRLVPIGRRRVTMMNGLGGYDDFIEETYYDPQMGGIFKKLKKAVKKVTKGVKKVVKSDAFKKLVLVGGAVAAGMFLGPAAAAAVKGVAGRLKAGVEARQARRAQARAEVEAATASEQATAQHTAAILNDPAIIEGIRSGRIPAPPTSVGGQAFLDWATSIGMTALNSDQQRQMSAAERSYLEEQLRSQMATVQQGAVQQLQRSPPPAPFSPDPDVPAEIQQVQAASLAGDNMKMAMMVGGGLLAASLLSQRGKR